MAMNFNETTIIQCISKHCPSNFSSHLFVFAGQPEVGGSMEWRPDSDGELTEDLTIRLVVRIVATVYVLYPRIPQVDLTERGLEQTHENSDLRPL